MMKPIIIDGVTLLNIIDACKTLKEHFYLVIGIDDFSFDIYAANESISRMTTTRCFAMTNERLPAFSFDMLASNEQISKIIPILSYEINALGIFQADNGSAIINFDNVMHRRMANLSAKFVSMTYTQSIPSSSEEVNRFVELTRSLRAADGVKFISVSGYIISTFSGIIPIAKADTVQISSYMQNNNTILFTFTVSKKKFRFPITVYILYLAIPSTNNSIVSPLNNTKG